MNLYFLMENGRYSPLMMGHVKHDILLCHDAQ